MLLRNDWYSSATPTNPATPPPPIVVFPIPFGLGGWGIPVTGLGFNSVCIFLGINGSGILGRGRLQGGIIPP